METTKKGVLAKSLDFIERVGNKLPDPAVLFFLLMIIIWIFSAIFSSFTFTEIDPRHGNPLEVKNLLTLEALAEFFSNMVTTFTSFAPLGIVLVAMLGVGVADDSGFIKAGLRSMLKFTPKSLLTPMLILVAIVSHTAADAGYVLVIPIGAVIFMAAGRHPIAGIAAAFAGVSGGFSANFVPSGIDPLLQGFTQSAARIIDTDIQLNPLNNWYFTSISSVLVILVGWYLTDKVIEPRLNKNTPYTGEGVEVEEESDLTKAQKRGFNWGLISLIGGLVLLFIWAFPEDSSLRDSDGEITSFAAPLMQSIVPIIFVIFLIPGVVYGYVSKAYKTSKDVIVSMTKSMHDMGYYIVMAFFCALDRKSTRLNSSHVRIS